MLTPIEYYKGAKGVHPTVLCRCDCGSLRIVRQTRLRLGHVTLCSKCAKLDAAKRGGETRRKFTPEQMAVRNKMSEYKQNAKKRNIMFKLSHDEFKSVVSRPCRYCGINANIGVDRLDNSVGYTYQNSVPCCEKCNYAKRDMTESEFLSLMERINAHQSR